MAITGRDSLKTRRTLTVKGQEFDYFSLKAAEETLGDVSRLPVSMKVLLENLLRYEDGRTVSVDDVKAVAAWQKDRTSTHEIAYRPARVLMQDFTGVPAVVDLAAMRQQMAKMGGDPDKINPLSTCNLVIDHSVMVDDAGHASSLGKNIELEFSRNAERYTFLKWGQTAFDNFTVVPPGTGICHQVNLEYLAKSVWTHKDSDGRMIAMPDTLVGTDSHTTMVNALAVLGWGVGGIEAEAAMLGQPISMVIPEVVGFKMTGKLKEGTTATDLVLMVVKMLREKGVVGKFVEFYGPALETLPIADKATISNMAPEYGATCGFFPIDKQTLTYLSFTGRDDETVALVEAYAREQGFWREAGTPDPVFTASLELDISTIEPSISGPKRPQDHIALSNAVNSFTGTLKSMQKLETPRSVEVANANYKMTDGNVVIAAITSCTTTSHPSVLVAAGLVARNALARGMTVKPWVKTSLAPGSQVVADYLKKAGLQDPLDALGFNIVGFGCTTCIGNSGPLKQEIGDAIDDNDLLVASVLSGNRNFEGRVHQQVRSNYLASPPLVVAYALAGSMYVDLFKDPLGQDKDGKDVYMKDIWPSNQEIADTIAQCLTPAMFRERYDNVYDGPPEWQSIGVSGGGLFEWEENSTYVKHPPYFENMAAEPGVATDIHGARPLLILGDSITTDHISPAGAIKKESPAGDYLLSYQIRPNDFNSYGSRRGNHEVMMRGT
ncbi:MAG: aconitate hydratase AcnA, partial [Rhodospirillales bacterium]